MGALFNVNVDVRNACGILVLKAERQNRLREQNFY
jgi:hypothetical protein